MAARLAVTGTNVGFGVYESIALLGRERALARLDRAAGLLGFGR
jgi:glutamyl/glutaminyl-tRNA synthetase